ncbi:hypothetical protein ACNJ7E_01120 [Rhodococcus sp. NM-2]|uniref:hypothetical protein n=1 Tax=Rhodococcus sp. NM-2 TaxID=3401174 RepID=UPI003AADCF9B
MHPTTTLTGHRTPELDRTRPAGRLRPGMVIAAVAAASVTGPAWIVTGSLVAAAVIAAATLAAVTAAALMI